MTRVDAQTPRRLLIASDQLDADMKRIRESRVAHHLYLDPAGAPFLITDQIIVSYSAPPTDSQLQPLLERYALSVVKRLGDRELILRLSDETGMNPVKLVVALSEALPEGVRLVEHNLEHLARRHEEESAEPLYPRQWHLHRESDHPDVDPRSSARCDGAWELLRGGGSEEIVVCVLDDGCALDHEDFNGPSKFAAWGYFDGDVHGGHVFDKRFIHSELEGADPARMHEEGQNHGTACCGVIGAERDGELTLGAAYGCRLLPIKVLSQGPYLYFDDGDLLEVLDYIADKVDVMSNSWGSSPSRLFAAQVIERLDRLSVSGGPRGQGILFLWAAGNENCLLNYEAEQPVPYTHGWQPGMGGAKWVGVETRRVFQNNLAEHPGVLHVAALASTAQRAHYSNYGPGIDLCAASSNAHAYYRMKVPGLGITTVEGDTTEGITHSFGGTSSATPLVAAVAALTLSADPSLSAVELRQILLDSANRDLNLSPYAKTPPADFDDEPSWDVSPIAPFDRGDFNQDGWSPWFGYGSVDATAAVRRALDRVGELRVSETAKRTPAVAAQHREAASSPPQSLIARIGAGLRRLFG